MFWLELRGNSLGNFMMISLRLFATMVVWTTLLGGCANYVNIPAQRGDWAMHNPNGSTVKLVLGEALRAVLKKHPFESKFAILLPENTTAKTYGAVASTVSTEAVWPGNRGRSDLPILEVKQLLIRGQDARVNIIRPVNRQAPMGSQEQLATVDLTWHPLQGWLAQRVRDWRLPVEEALRISADATDE